MRKRYAWLAAAAAALFFLGAVLWQWPLVLYMWQYRLALYPASTLTFVTNPVELPPHIHSDADSAEDDGHHVSSASLGFVAPRDLWITGADARIANAPDAVLHHADLFDPDHMQSACPEKYPAWILLFSQDQMHDPHMALPPGYALFVPKGTPLVLSAEYHNAEPPVGPGGEYHNVSVGVTLHLVYPSAAHPLKPVYLQTLFLEDNPCSGTEPYQFAVPAHSPRYVFGPTGTSSPARLVVAADTTILYAGAHLHGWQGADSLVFKDNGVPLMVFDTTLSTTTPYRYDTPHFATSTPLKKGDVLTIEARYHNYNNAPERGVMGMLGLYLVGTDTSPLAPVEIEPKETSQE